MLASLLYPYDDDAPSLIEGWLTELEKWGCIRRYEIEGSHYLEVTNWLKHQKIDRPSASRLPPYSPSPREPSMLILDLGPLPVPAFVVSDQNFASHSPLKLRLFESLYARGQLRRFNRACVSVYNLT
jgi:hypothetical protein